VRSAESLLKTLGLEWSAACMRVRGDTALCEDETDRNDSSGFVAKGTVALARQAGLRALLGVRGVSAKFYTTDVNVEHFDWSMRRDLVRAQPSSKRLTPH